MRFDRMNTTMEALTARQDFTMTDVLNAFYDLCADIKDARGSTVDKLPAGDEDVAVTRLCWMGRTFLRMAGQIPADSVEEEKNQRLQKVIRELEKSESELGAAEQRIRELEKQQKGMQAQKAELAGSLKREAALKQECDRLKEELESYKELEIPGFLARKETLKKELIKIKDSRDEEEQLCEQLERELGESKREKEQSDRRLEDIRKQKEAVEKQLAQTEEKYKELRERVQHSDTLRRSLLEKIDMLEKTLGCKDTENLLSLYEEKKQEAQVRRKEYQQLQEKVQEKEEELVRLKEDMVGKNKYIQELAWQEENEKKNAELALKELQKRIEDARSKKRDLQVQVQNQEEEAESLEEWFKSLEAEAYEKRLKASGAQLEVMQKARDSLEEELSVLSGIVSKEEREELFRYQKYFRDTMDNLERDLEQYQKCYCTVMKVFENGGNGL